MGWNQELITHAEIDPFIGILELQSGTATHQSQPLVFSLVVPGPFGLEAAHDSIRINRQSGPWQSIRSCSSPGSKSGP